MIDYEAFTESVRSNVAPGVRVELYGSVARGEAVPGYSDLDLILVAPDGEGPALRDDVPAVARGLGRLLTIFADPFSSEGCICSVYSGPFKVDWWVAEDRPDGRVFVWAGLKPPPTDSDGHPWDWMWWLWCKIRTGKSELAAHELSKLWQFLVLRGVPQASFPPTVPDPERDDLAQLALATLEFLPACAIGDEVRPAIEADARSL